jgi:hypothetical protein
VIEEAAAALDFLGGMAQDLVGECSVLPARGVPGSPLNATGGTLIRPGGRDCYPSFWIRDFALCMESGIFSRELILHALRVTAESQSDTSRELPSGALIPEGAIADHVNFDAAALYFPGSYDPLGQGGEPWGQRPSFDDQFYFVRMAAHFVAAFEEPRILDLELRGRTLLERCVLAFDVVPVAEGSQLVACGDENRGINFGFMDSVRQTGLLLFASLLRCVAAEDLARLMRAAGSEREASLYEAIASGIRAEIPEAFARGPGLLRAATGRSGQNDVWGSAFAVSAGLVSGSCELGICERLRAAYREGSLAWRGNIRQVLVGDDSGDAGPWEEALSPRNRYQNGAYWGTPLGWVVDAIARVDAGAARELFLDYAAELREGDFRRGEGFDSPVECMHPEGMHRQNPLYLASVACPLPVLRRVFGQMASPLQERREARSPRIRS